LFAPIFGRYGAQIGPKILYNCGAYLQGICGVAFGFLTYIENANLFIGLSYLLRSETLGTSVTLKISVTLKLLLKSVFPPCSALLVPIENITISMYHNLNDF
jgi:hypothetical protein